MKTKRELRAERLVAARSRLFDDATSAARAHGWNENTYRSHENAQRGFKPDTAEIYAKALKTSFRLLWSGEEDSAVSPLSEIEKALLEAGTLGASEQQIVLDQINTLVKGLKGRKFPQ